MLFLIDNQDETKATEDRETIEREGHKSIFFIKFGPTACSLHKELRGPRCRTQDVLQETIVLKAGGECATLEG